MANTPVSATITTVVFTPSSSGTPHAYLYNQGASTVYLGGSGVSTTTGMPLLPGDRADLSTMPFTVYAVSGYNTTTPIGTVVTATTTFPGGTILTGGGTVFTAGMWIAVESGTPRQELAQVLASNAGSVITTAALQFAHGTATTFQQITATPSSVFNAAVGAT